MSKKTKWTKGVNRLCMRHGFKIVLSLSIVLVVGMIITGATMLTVIGDMEAAEAKVQEAEAVEAFIPFFKPTPPPTPTPSPVHTAKLLFVGDLMVHQPQMDAAFVKDSGDYDFDYCFSKVKPYLEDADLTIGNLETVLGGEKIGYSDFPMFNSPDQLGFALKRAGFDLLTTANNHCNDKKEAGLLRTLDVLDSLALGHFGTYRSQEERDTIFVQEVNNITFAFLSYTYGTNGLPLTAGKDYLANIMDEELIRADIARAKALNPDFVIVMPHMGNEYELTPAQTFKNWVSMMLNAGADVVIASHPHVVQPMAFMDVEVPEGGSRQAFVAYSMGNFVSSQRTQPREAGLMLNLYFEKVGNEKAIIKEASYMPTWVKFTTAAGGRDIIILPVTDTLRAMEAGENVDLRQKDKDRVRAVHKELGERLLGYVPPLMDEYSLTP